MIHTHGTPVGGSRQDAARFLQGRHALIPHARQDDLGVAADVCKDFVFDNSAFTEWKQGKPIDVEGFTRWCEEWMRHPGFAWGLIPDIIGGSEEDNDALLAGWPKHIPGVPVWHLHESLARLERLVHEFAVVALGSSGEWPTPGAKKWWVRMHQAMEVACDRQGRPLAKLHGLRMLNPKVFTKLPLYRADSVNAAMNCGALDRFGMYVPPTAAQRAAVIAERVESHNSAPIWMPFIPEFMRPEDLL